MISKSLSSIPHYEVSLAYLPDHPKGVKINQKYRNQSIDQFIQSGKYNFINFIINYQIDQDQY